jgi:PAS domain S-box-containing protein
MTDFSLKNPDETKRKTGIDIIGDVPWGTHFCQFYQSKEDLIDILVPYFKAGLENNEFCMWITSEPLHVEEARKELSKQVKNVDEYIKKGQIEILDSTQWYTKSGKFDADEVLSGWVRKEAWARRKGFDGLRLTGNTFWLEKKDWRSFSQYEATVNDVIGNYNMIGICSYSLDKCNANELLDVMNTHQFALIKYKGKWKIIESSERKKIISLLHEYEQKSQTLIKHAPAGIYEIDFREPRFLSVNDVMCQYLGYGRKELLSMNPLDFLDEKSKQLFQERMKKQLAGEKVPSSTEYTIKTKDGRTLYAELNITFTYEGDKCVGAFVIAHDITERKRFEQEIHRQALLLSQVHDGVIATDPNFRINYWNKGAEQIYGYSEAETLGKTTVELLRPIYAPNERKKIIDKIKSHGTSRAIIHTKHKNGADVIVEITAARVNDELGNISGYVITYRDVTEQKKAQEALKDAEIKYRTVADNTHDFEFWLDPKENFLYVSPSCKRITGYRVKDFLSNPSLRKTIIHPDDQALFHTHSQEEMKKKKPGSLEFRIIHKNGSIRWISHACQPIYDEAGKFLGIRGSNREITERKKTEEALRKSEEKYRTLFDSMTEGFVLGKTIFDEKDDPVDHVFLEVNDAFEKQTGIKKEVILNKPVTNAIPGIEKDPADWIGVYGKVAKTGEPAQFENYAQHEKKWYSLYVYSPMKDHFAVIFNDITERKKAEEELRRKNVEIRTLFDNSPACLVLFDANPPYKVLVHNKSYQELFAEPFKSKGMVGLNVYDYAPEVESSGAVAVFDEVVKTKQPKIFLDFPYNSNPPNETWFNWYISPIIIDGKVVSLVSMSLDVTDRHKIEKELRKTNEELTRFNRAMVGREIRMIELKKQVNELSSRLGQPEPFHIDNALNPKIQMKLQKWLDKKK